MIEVELPDGTIAEFPDGTSNDVIKGALQKRFALAQPQMEAPPSPQFQEAMAGMSAATQNPARAAYDNMPAWQKPLVAASDLFQLAGSGASFGFGEKAAAAVRAPFTDKTYEEELAAQRALTQGARNRAGGAGTAAEIGGAIATPMGLANKGLTLAGRLGTGAMTGAGGLAARTGLMGLEGAGYGALTAAGNDQDITTGAGIGALGGAGGNLVGEALSAGASKIAGMFNKKPPTITPDAVKAQGRAAYKAAEAEGVMFNPVGTDKLYQNVVNDLTASAFDPALAPGAVPALKRIKALRGQNVTFEGLDSIRKVAANGYDPTKPYNNKAISEVINRIDELVNQADPTTILAGRDPARAASLVNEGRANWHRARKMETIAKHVQKGEDIGNSQVNADTAGATRRQLRSILMSDTKSRGFTKAETKALRTAAGYTPGQRMLHSVGGLLPRDRLTSAIQAGVGLSTGGASIPFQLAGAGVGYGAQKAQENIAKKSVDELIRLVSGAPGPTKNAAQRLAEAKREAIARALMAAMATNAGAQ